MLQEIIGRLPELTGSQLGRLEDEIRRERQRRASSEGGGEGAPQIHEGTAPPWTLFVIVRSGFLAGRELPNVRRAYRTLQGAVQTYPVGPGSCDGRTYNRLNADYEPMHALCRFFLNNSGPTHERGDRSMLPFLVNMPRLYELFVSEWLNRRPPLLSCRKALERRGFVSTDHTFE